MCATCGCSGAATIRLHDHDDHDHDHERDHHDERGHDYERERDHDHERGHGHGPGPEQAADSPAAAEGTGQERPDRAAQPRWLAPREHPPGESDELGRKPNVPARAHGQELVGSYHGLGHRRRDGATKEAVLVATQWRPVRPLVQCPTGRPARARTPSRCGTRQHPRARTQLPPPSQPLALLTPVGLPVRSDRCWRRNSSEPRNCPDRLAAASRPPARKLYSTALELPLLLGVRHAWKS